MKAPRPEAPRPGSARPSPADLAAAANRTIPDVLPGAGEPLHVLFCGINPGLYSAATGWHFARPGNRFWPALRAAGFTPRLLAPSEQQEITRYGLKVGKPLTGLRGILIGTPQLVNHGAPELANGKRE